MSLNRQDPGIACVSCGSTEHRVRDSRTHENRLYRRRECKKCGVRFSTIEEPVAESGRSVGVVTHHEKLLEAVTAFVSAFSTLAALTTPTDPKGPGT